MTWFLLTESAGRPALFLGTSSDRIGSPADTQSYFLTASKRHPRWPVSAYASLNYSEWDDGWNIPFGIEYEIAERVSVRPMFDGDRSHLTLNFTALEIAGHPVDTSLLWVWFERFGIAFSTRF